MQCPKCGNLNSGTVFLQGPTRPLPLQLRGLPLQRRRRRCLRCAELFWTVEILEDDFDRLKKPSTLAEPHQADLRSRKE